MIADANLIDIKHQVLEEVARLAFEKNLEEGKEDIPYKLIKGPNPTFRCCIFKEREIIRQRVKLAEGKNTSYSKSDNIMQVIYAACADCPISAYTVTENCQNCIGKPCINSCKFGAIKPGRYRSHIDASKCKECGMCAKACPYNAIAHLVRPCKFSCPVDAITYDENGLSEIDDTKCIRCGKCMHSCPFGAIGTKADLVSVIKAIQDPEKNVYLMAAPATEGQHGEGITMKSWKNAALEAGFTEFVEVGLGGDMTAAYEALEWAEAYKDGKKMTTSCCPAFVNLIRRHYKKLEDSISTTISPMCANSRMIKAKDPNAVTVFLGPCIAKKSEAHEFGIEGNADFVLTYSEMEAVLYGAGVELKPAENDYQEASVYGKNFAQSGGVTTAVLQSLKEIGEEFDASVCKANGVEECKKALMLLSRGRLPEDFIEGMVCDGGCVNGPSQRTAPNLCKKNRTTMINEADKRGINENLKNYDMDAISMHRK